MYESVQVKFKNEVVAEIEVPVYATVEAALAELGDETVLGLINRQHKADLSNKERAKHRPSSTGKNALRQAAFKMACEDPELKVQLDALMGDFAGLQVFLDSLAEQVKESM